MAYEPTEWARGTKITAQKLNNIESGVQSVNSEYTPTTWAEGDIVTATKLNNIEQGIVDASSGGYLGLHTVNVSVTFDTSEVGGETPEAFSEVDCLFYYPDDIDYVFELRYSTNSYLPLSLIGTPSNMTIPVAEGMETAFYLYYDNGSLADVPTVISGDARIRDGLLLVSGDCAISIKLGWQD